MQGFLFSRPLQADEVERLLLAGEAPTQEIQSAARGLTMLASLRERGLTDHLQLSHPLPFVCSPLKCRQSIGRIAYHLLTHTDMRERSA